MSNKHNVYGTDLERWRAVREQARDILRRTDAAKRERNRAILQKARDTLRRTDLAERERRRAIIAQARETLRRGQPMPPQVQKDHIQRERRRVIEQARESLRFWQRKTPRAPSVAETKKFIDDRIAAAFEAHNDAIGQFVAGIRQQLRGEIAAACAELRADIAKTLGNGSGEVIELPALPSLRRRHDGNAA